MAAMLHHVVHQGGLLAHALTPLASRGQEVAQRALHEQQQQQQQLGVLPGTRLPVPIGRAPANAPTAGSSASSKVVAPPSSSSSSKSLRALLATGAIAAAASSEHSLFSVAFGGATPRASPPASGYSSSASSPSRPASSHAYARRTHSVGSGSSAIGSAFGKLMRTLGVHTGVQASSFHSHATAQVSSGDALSFGAVPRVHRGSDVEQDSDTQREEDLNDLQRDMPTYANAPANASAYAIAQTLGATSRRQHPRPAVPNKFDSFRGVSKLDPEAQVTAFTASDNVQKHMNEDWAEEDIEEVAEQQGISIEDAEAMVADVMEPELEQSSRNLSRDLVQLAAQQQQATDKPADPQRKRELRLATPHTPEAFFQSRPRDLSNFNHLLHVCAEQGRYEEGMRVYHEELLPRVVPNEQTYLRLIQLCNTPGGDAQSKLSYAFALLERYKATFSGRVDEKFYNALACAAGRLDSPARAMDVVKLMRSSGVPPSQVTYSEIIRACDRAGGKENVRIAVGLMNEMEKGMGSNLEADTRAYNAMINLCASNHDADVAVQYWDRMIERHYMPDKLTYTAIIRACGKSSNHYIRAVDYFAQYINQFGRPDVTMCNVVLHACAQAGKGDVANGLKVFKLMEEKGVIRDTVSYNSLLNVLAESMHQGDRVPLVHVSGGSQLTPAQLTPENSIDKSGRIAMAEALLAQMEQTHVPIDITTVNTAVKVSAMALKLNTTITFQEKLMAAHGFQPDEYSYRTILEMYLNASRIGPALEQMDLMRSKGFKISKALYTEMLNKVQKPSKKKNSSSNNQAAAASAAAAGGAPLSPAELLAQEVAQIESWGQRVLEAMRADGVAVNEDLARKFYPDAWDKHRRLEAEQRERHATMYTGVAHSYTRRADAMLRPQNKQPGTARVGSQATRIARDDPYKPVGQKLATHKAKRGQRAAEKKDRAQGINTQKQRERQTIAGHFFDAPAPAPHQP